MGRLLSIETTSGEPVAAGNVTVTPLARALVVRTPFGGLVRNRPIGVLVERDGRVERKRIPDVTRLLQFGLLASSIIAVVAVAALGRRKE
jgi:hypothetical protein